MDKDEYIIDQRDQPSAAPGSFLRCPAAVPLDSVLERTRLASAFAVRFDQSVQPSAVVAVAAMAVAAAADQQTQGWAAGSSPLTGRS